MSNRDLYSMLGVTSSATKEEIKHAFRERATQVHPDRNGGDGVAMADLSAAYKVLSDRELRKIYDATGDTSGWVISGTEAQNYSKATETVVPQYTTEVKTEGKTEKGNGTTTSTEGWYATREAAAGMAAEYYASTDFGVFGGGEDERVSSAWGPQSRENGTLLANPRIKIAEAEFNLLAGMVEAMNSKGPFEAECGDYKIVKDKDVDGKRGEIRVEVRLNRFANKENDKVQVRAKGSLRYEGRTLNDFIPVEDISLGSVTGVNIPPFFKNDVKRIVDVAGRIGSGEKISAWTLATLELAGRASFPNEMKVVEVTPKDLQSSLEKAVNNWRIPVREGDLFQKREGVTRDRATRI